MMEFYLPIAELPVNIWLIVGMSAVVGFISGLFGVGGGFLITPLLIFLGIPPAVVVATVSTQIAASSLTALISHWKRRALDIKLGLLLLSGSSIGTVCGVMAFNALRRVGQLDLTIGVSYIILLGGIGLLMLYESLKAFRARRSGRPVKLSRGGNHPWYFGLPFRMRFPASGLYVSVIPLLAMALIVGFFGALLGIGGGFMIVPALIYLFRVPTMVVVGTSMFQILFSMSGATMLHATTNHSVDFVLAWLLIIGGVFGAQFGARAGRHLKGEQFRLLLALIVLAVALRFLGELALKPDDVFSLAVSVSPAARVAP